MDRIRKVFRAKSKAERDAEERERAARRARDAARPSLDLPSPPTTLSLVSPRTIYPFLPGSHGQRLSGIDIPSAGLDKSIFQVEIWSEESIPGLETFRLPASRFLRLDRQEYDSKLVTSSYSFTLFRDIFQEYINGQLESNLAIDMQYGTLEYFPSSGLEPLRVIHTQQDFEVAFYDLFQGRKNTFVLLVVFRKETPQANFWRTGNRVEPAAPRRSGRSLTVGQNLYGKSTSPTKSTGSAKSAEKDGDENVSGDTPGVDRGEPAAEENKTPDVEQQPTLDNDEAVQAQTGEDAKGPSVNIDVAKKTTESTGADNEEPALATETANQAEETEAGPSTPRLRVRQPSRLPTRLPIRLPTSLQPRSVGNTSRPSTAMSSRSGRSIPSPSPSAPRPRISQLPSPRTSVPRSIQRISNQVSPIKKAIKKVINPPKKEKCEELRAKFNAMYKQESSKAYAEKEVTAENDGDDGGDGDGGGGGGDGGGGDDDDEDISNENRVVGQLQKLTNLEGMDQFRDMEKPNEYLYRWRETCKMFRIDPTQVGIDERVKVAGLKTPIYQYQAFGVYWQMITSREMGGGFLADAMGLGKTLSFIAYMVVERQLSVLWMEVNNSREKKDGRHLPDGADEEAKCPGKQRPEGWIACPCEPSSPTSKLMYKEGLRMACVPTDLVGSWFGQWKAHVDTSDVELGLRIVVDHPASFDNMKVEDASRSSNLKTIERCRATKYANPMNRRDLNGDDTAKPYQDGILVLTTQIQAPLWIKKFEAQGRVRDDKKLGEWKTGRRIQLVFGIAMIDECHEDYLRNSGRNRVLFNLPSVNQPFLWGYSGTPFSHTPRGIEGVLWAIEKHAPVTEEGKTGWQSDPKMLPFQYSRLNNLSLRFDTQLRSDTRDDAAVQKVLDDFKPFLLKFMIRRTGASRWFKHPLVELNNHIHRDIQLRHNNPLYTPDQIAEFEGKFQSERDSVLAAQQERWDKFPALRRSDVRPTQLAFGIQCQTEWRSRLLATFPYLLRLSTEEATETVAEGHRLDLTINEIEAITSSEAKEKASGYSYYLRAIVEASPKAMWLTDFICKLENQKDVNGNEEKLIILTNFPQVAYIVKLFIERYIPDKKDRVGMIAGRMPLKTKNDIVDAFTDATDLKGNRSTPANYQILVGTTRLIGLGLQLTRSCNVVLMEPDYLFANELQGHARVHRIGQKNPISYSYRLINSESEIEQRILRRQAQRNEFPGVLVDEKEAPSASAPPTDEADNEEVSLAIN